MSGLLGALFAIFLGAVAAYYLAPGAVFHAATLLARRSAGLSLRTLTLDGQRVPYLEGGRGEPLVLLHGFAASKDHWLAIAPLLTRHFRVIVPDVPGFGDSSRDRSARYGLDDQLARLAAFARALGLPRFHLGGNSMGGYLAAMFAARQPQAVASLWLLAPAGVASAAPSPLQESLARGDNPLLVRDAGAFERLAGLCFEVEPPLPAQFRRVLIARAIAEAPFNAKLFEELFTAPLALETAIDGSAIRTLVVWGDRDRVLDPSGLEVLRGRLADAEFIRMRRMGHLPMVERPVETAADFLRFHGRTPASG